MTFGERLKQARVNSGISQADAAKSMEMSRPTLSAIEADKRKVLAAEIIKFADLYHVSVVSLMGGEDTSVDEVGSKQLARLVKYQNAFQTLDKKKQKKVLQYIKKLQDES